MFPNRLTEIDDLTRKDHFYLEVGDPCYYLGEYTARQGYAFSETNHLIYNLKKSPERRGRPEWWYKEQAISTAAQALRRNFKMVAIARGATLVPMPPSKARSDALYDDRMLRVLQQMCEGYDADIRELVLQRESTNAAHASNDRPSPEELAENYYINKSVAEPAPGLILIFDDVITTGSHYKAMEIVLKDRYPEVQIAGFFVARRVPETSEIEDLQF